MTKNTAAPEGGKAPAGVTDAGLAPPAPPAGKMAVEHWATKHGMLPEIFKGGALALPPGVAGQKAVRVSLAQSSQVAPRSNPKFVEFRAAQLHNNWVIGHECTEAEFLAAVAKAYGPEAEVVCR